jgi:hypothetical protein
VQRGSPSTRAVTSHISMLHGILCSLDIHFPLMDFIFPAIDDHGNFRSLRGAHLSPALKLTDTKSGQMSFTAHKSDDVSLSRVNQIANRFFDSETSLRCNARQWRPGVSTLLGVFSCLTLLLATECENVKEPICSHAEHLRIVWPTIVLLIATFFYCSSIIFLLLPQMKNGHLSLPICKRNSLRRQRGDGHTFFKSDEHVPVCSIHSLQVCKGIIIVLQEKMTVSAPVMTHGKVTRKE